MPALRPPLRLPRRATVVTAALGTGAALALFFTAIRLFGWEFSWPLRTLVAYTPYLTAAALIVPVAAALLRRRAIAVAAIVPPLVLACLIAPRGFAGEQPDAAGPRLTIATANLYLGAADPAALVRLVTDENVDVLSVQELTPAAADALTAAGIADLLPYQALNTIAGAEGTGVYARYPLTENPDPVPGSTFRMTSVDIAVPGAPPLEIVSVHPAAPYAPAMVDPWLDDLARLPRAGDGLRVLAGDFNATLDHAALRDVLDSGYADAADEAGDGLTGTWQPRDGSRLSLLGVEPPRVALDHVLVDRRIAVRSTHIGDLPGADHHPLVAGLTLPEQ